MYIISDYDMLLAMDLKVIRAVAMPDLHVLPTRRHTAHTSREMRHGCERILSGLSHLPQRHESLALAGQSSGCVRLPYEAWDRERWGQLGSCRCN